MKKVLRLFLLLPLVAQAEPQLLAHPSRGWNAGGVGVGTTSTPQSADTYHYYADACRAGDRISCNQARDMQRILRNNGWCLTGPDFRVCPGYVEADPRQWNDRLANQQASQLRDAIRMVR